MKKLLFAVCLSLFAGLLFNSCSKTEEHFTPQELEVQSDVSLFAGESQTLTIKGGTAPYSVRFIKSTDAITYQLNKDQLSITANAKAHTGVKPQHAVLIVSDQEGKEKNISVDVYNLLKIDTTPITAYAGQSADIRIIAAKTKDLKVESNRPEVATAVLEKRQIGGDALYIIKVSTLKEGEALITVSDGYTKDVPTVKVTVLPVENVVIKAAVNGEFVPVTERVIPIPQPQGEVFAVAGGIPSEGYTIDYDTHIFETITIEEDELDGALMTVKVKDGFADNTPTTIVVAQKSNPANKAELHISFDVNLPIAFQLFEGDRQLNIDKDSSDDPLIHLQVGHTYTLQVLNAKEWLYIPKAYMKAQLGAKGLVDYKLPQTADDPEVTMDVLKVENGKSITLTPTAPDEGSYIKVYTSKHADFSEATRAKSFSYLSFDITE